MQFMQKALNGAELKSSSHFPLSQDSFFGKIMYNRLTKKLPAFFQVQSEARPQSLETAKYGHESRGLETKNHCAGKDQQQFTRPD
jgi:hypothetical protein